MKDLQEKIAYYITSLFEKRQDRKLVYHNFSHTVQVVRNATKLIDFYNLTPEDAFILRTAAWFHDVGHLFGVWAGHEEVGVATMRTYLTSNGCVNDMINQIADCIMATRIPSHPANLNEKILCDADTWHVGTDEFFVTDQQVREELLLREGIEMEDWDSCSLNFLQEHQYFTTYCQQTLQPGKLDNIATLKSRIKDNSRLQIR